MQLISAHNLLPKDGEAHYLKNLLSNEEAIQLFEILLNGIEWEHDEVRIFGKTFITNRKVAWYGDPNLYYKYSGRSRKTKDWLDPLLVLKRIVEAETKCQFNSCLLNYYKNGEDYMGWHSDDEPELGDEPVIASLSLGATRSFLFKHKLDDMKCGVELESGSLLLMQGATQDYWKHSLPKRKRVLEARINLTFRKIL